MLKILTLNVLFALIISQGTCVSINIGSLFKQTRPPDYVPQQVIAQKNDGLVVMWPAPPSRGQPICSMKKADWIVHCDSQRMGNDCRFAVDNDTNTFWSTELHSVPESITIDLQDEANVNAIQLPPSVHGGIAAHEVYLSIDGATWGNPVAYGTWSTDVTDKYAIFEPQKAHFIRLVIHSSHPGSSHVSIAEIDIWATEQVEVLQPATLGKWGPTVNFPLVPSGAWVDPINGTVIVFASDLPNHFLGGSGSGRTVTAVWNSTVTGNQTNGTVTPRAVIETQHDMFCSGMSFDVDGRMIVTGGNGDDKTSIYNATGKWWKAQPMNIQRGYQGQTTLPDGRVFVIGGSWHGGIFSKQAEVYNITANNWTLLDGVPGKSIEETEDTEGQYRWDNHVWLFGWKNDSVFHAGPSKMMHWMTTNGRGSNSNASARAAGSITDRDAMCGIAAMYDAINGSILISGGEPNYKYYDDGGNPKRPYDQPPNSGGCGIPGTGDTFGNGRKVCPVQGKPASNNSFVVTLGKAKVNSNVTVELAGKGMNFNRIFHHAVILPTGDTLIVGGQQLGHGFTDQTPQLTPEIYSPVKNAWTNVASHSIIRVYHSFGLLLPDARVLVGGGGLCGACTVNHLDTQVYSPPYLFTAAGTEAQRPNITSALPAIVRPGSTITIQTDSKVVAASLIRYSGATHGLNNDQRRIPYTLQQSSTPNQYSITIPAEKSITIPGYWMLFVVNEQGVPSLSARIQILIA